MGFRTRSSCSQSSTPRGAAIATWSHLVLDRMARGKKLAPEFAPWSMRMAFKITTLQVIHLLRNHMKIHRNGHVPRCVGRIRVEEKAASALKSDGVSLAKVDATEEKELAKRFEVKGRLAASQAEFP